MVFGLPLNSKNLLILQPLINLQGTSHASFYEEPISSMCIFGGVGKRFGGSDCAGEC
jgi:hypothetical protein